ncbi:hypothetical protein D3C76_741550 [compost metagenome]
MNRLGQLAFTGAGLPKDQDVGIGIGHLAGGLEHDLHGRAVRVQTFLGFTHLTFQSLQTSRQLPHFQLFGRGQAQLIGAARLDQIIRGTRLNRINGGVYGRMRGDDHHAHPWGLDAHLCQNVQTVVLPQAQIEEAQVENLTLQQGFSLRSAVSGRNAVAFIFKAIAEGSQDGRLIIHQKNAALMLSGGFHFPTLLNE